MIEIIYFILNSMAGFLMGIFAGQLIDEIIQDEKNKGNRRT
jgi:hypothetical protein